MNHQTTVLIVDDNLLNLLLVADLLEHANCAVLRAENVDEAQALLKETKPDLMLLDIQMPGMDGLTFTRMLKADPDYQQIPIVALTALAMKGDKEKVMAAGCDGYISKPIDTRRFPEQIATYLQPGALSPGD